MWWCGSPAWASVPLGLAPPVHGLGPALDLGPCFEGAPLTAMVVGVVASEAAAVWAGGGGCCWHGRSLPLVEPLPDLGEGLFGLVGVIVHGSYCRESSTPNYMCVVFLGFA